MNTLFPAIEPHHTEFVKVSSLHTIYVEECGNPCGKPVLFIHGGPGGGIRPSHRTFFNPSDYRIILVDQRGCGKSIPHAEVRENTLQDLIGDFEKIRQLFKINKWSLFGGSWGSTLALAYAQAHPEFISDLVLRGIFLGRPKELAFLYQYGASEVFPEAWEQYIAMIPEHERTNLIAAYQKRLFGTDKALQYQAAQAWATWEASISKLAYDQNFVNTYNDPEFALAFARIENHYFMNQLFLEPNQLLRNVDRIRHIPARIVHGRYDMCCPVSNAWDLHKAWPESELFIAPNAGHSATEPEIASYLVHVTNQLVNNK